MLLPTNQSVCTWGNTQRRWECLHRHEYEQCRCFRVQSRVFRVVAIFLDFYWIVAGMLHNSWCACSAFHSSLYSSQMPSQLFTICQNHHSSHLCWVILCLRFVRRSTAMLMYLKMITKTRSFQNREIGIISIQHWINSNFNKIRFRNWNYFTQISNQ